MAQCIADQSTLYGRETRISDLGSCIKTDEFKRETEKEKKEEEWVFSPVANVGLGHCTELFTHYDALRGRKSGMNINEIVSYVLIDIKSDPTSMNSR